MKGTTQTVSDADETLPAPTITINGPEATVDEFERTSQVIERLLTEQSHLLKNGRAIVESTFDKKRSLYRCLLITEATLDVLRTNPDVFTLHVPKTITFSSTSFKKTVFFLVKAMFSSTYVRSSIPPKRSTTLRRRRVNSNRPFCSLSSSHSTISSLYTPRASTLQSSLHDCARAV
jgi:hypothetical protein